MQTISFMHMSRSSTWTVRNRKHLNTQANIHLSDDKEADKDSDRVRSSAGMVENDGDAVHEEAPAPGDSSDAPPTRKKASPPPDPYFLLLLGHRELGCCSEGLLQPPVL